MLTRDDDKAFVIDAISGVGAETVDGWIEQASEMIANYADENEG